MNLSDRVVVLDYGARSPTARPRKCVENRRSASDAYLRTLSRREAALAIQLFEEQLHAERDMIRRRWTRLVPRLFAPSSGVPVGDLAPVVGARLRVGEIHTTLMSCSMSTMVAPIWC